MSNQYRVMQSTETGEEFCAFQGTEDACEDWLVDNEDEYPESGFYLELVRRTAHRHAFC